ncbi:hypothetical protein A2111_02110 [Candidatus Daviesbacteria bacterium GWA1_38_6]|nr:MAG: hypothetical protein A2111_02110 [Candidatus Daviesbacteria bacterium GWA1_38_6]
MAELIATIAGEKFRCGITETIDELSEGLRINANNNEFKGVIIFDTDLDNFVKEAVGVVGEISDKTIPIGVITTDDESLFILSDKMRLLRLTIGEPVHLIEEFISTLIRTVPQSA